QELLYVRALLVPGRYSMNGEGMPHVMQPRLVSSAIGTADTGILAQAFEGLLHELDRDALAFTQDEERRSLALRVAHLSSRRGVLSHNLIEIESKRHQPGLVKLRLGDGDHGAEQVYIAERETDGLAD